MSLRLQMATHVEARRAYYVKMLERKRSVVVNMEDANSSISAAVSTAEQLDLLIKQLRAERVSDSEALNPTLVFP